MLIKGQFPSDLLPIEIENKTPESETPESETPKKLLSNTLRIKKEIPKKDSTNIINSFERPTEEIQKLLSYLYSGAENSISDCLYSDSGYIIAIPNNACQHYDNVNPNYRTSIDINFLINQVAYIIAGMKLHKTFGSYGLKKFQEKSKELDFFISELHIHFSNMAYKDPDSIFEGFRGTTHISESLEGVNGTYAFRLLNSKNKTMNYANVTFTDKLDIETKTEEDFSDFNKFVSPSNNSEISKEEIEKASNLIFSLYSNEENTIKNCKYNYPHSFIAEVDTSCHHYENIQPNYLTAIDLNFLINQAAYLIAGINYLKEQGDVGLQKYIKKAENLELFIIDYKLNTYSKASKDNKYLLKGIPLWTKKTTNGIINKYGFLLTNKEGKVFSHLEVTFFDKTI